MRLEAKTLNRLNVAANWQSMRCRADEKLDGMTVMWGLGLGNTNHSRAAIGMDDERWLYGAEKQWYYPGRGAPPEQVPHGKWKAGGSVTSH